MTKNITIKLITTIAIITNLVSTCSTMWNGIGTVDTIAWMISFIWIELFIYANTLYKDSNKFIDKKMDLIINHIIFMAGLYVMIYAGVRFIKMDLGYTALIDMILIGLSSGSIAYSTMELKKLIKTT